MSNETSSTSEPTPPAGPASDQPAGPVYLQSIPPRLEQKDAGIDSIETRDLPR
jgi:hypothetical protein